MERRNSMTLAAGLATLARADDTSAAEDLFKPDLSHGEDYTRADCGEVAVGGAVGEIAAIPEEASFEITGFRDTKEHGVEVSPRTPRKASRLSVRTFLLPDEARDIARRLEAAAVVAEGSRE